LVEEIAHCRKPVVSLVNGTGIVHIAPAFGEDDANVGRNYDLPFVQLVNDKGELTEDTPYAGLFVKDADPKVLVDLDKRGQLFDAPKFEHDYPHCWRCDTPLIYYARESWFIKMTEVKDKLVANNNTVNWIKVHSTQNCCFSYVYFSMQRVYYLVFVYENEQFCAR
jgi:isoleucyl-tRNA synthetase